MKIKSKFKDYYDHVQAYGQDTDISYIRNTEKYCNVNNHVHNNKWFKVERDDEGRDILTEEYDMKYPIDNFGGGFIDIYFCGKVYHTLKVEQTSDRYGKIIPEEYFYDADKFAKYFETANRSHADRYYLKDKLKNLSENGKVRTNINQKLGHPVIMVRYDWYMGLQNIYNPRLNEIQFQKAVDPYTAFMELDMFISGVLGKTGGEMVTISDKDKIYKHGFDYKYGFRTRKE